MRIQKKPVEGAVLQIEDLQGKVIVEKWKQKRTKQIEKLPEGEYVLVEAEAPFGYQKAEKIEFRVEPRKEVQKITLYNRKSEKEKLPEESTGKKDTPKSRRYSDSRKAHCGVAWSFSVTWIDLLQKARSKEVEKTIDKAPTI